MTTTVIGQELRSFRDTTKARFKTVELPGETAARARRGAHKKAAVDPSALPPPPPLPSPPKGKFLNLLTYKFHVLGTTRGLSASSVLLNPTPPRSAKQAAASPQNRTSRTFSENDDSAYTGLDLHHHISKLCKDPIHLLKFVQENPRDLAKNRFIPKLKDHLLSRLLNHDFDGDEAEYSEEQRNTVHIIQQKIYPVQTMRVNFTTYNMRQDQDTINP
ncbi:hypothetical protein B0H10DRAFT_2232231 [Mycena sp. CBHHK59/15]|nr:hypothetical protein B0H10DRAFT_2232231 [Mycena sp. CBHHK59/15]